MAGIVSYGAYLPLWRLKRDSIVKGLPGEKTVANFDEDSITMAVAAASDCFRGVARETVDGLFFASLSSPYKEKLAAATVATAADLRRDVLTADFANSLRSGSIALKAALDAVQAGSGKQVVVVASDCRQAMPGSDLEQNAGDGAVALLLGQGDEAVSIEASHSVCDEMWDVWQAADEDFPRAWEGRFVATQGYFRVVEEAVKAFFKKSKLGPKDFTKVVFGVADARRQQELARTLGFDLKTQLQDSLFAVMGDTGAAYSLTLLVAALEAAKPGDRILFVSYGNGCDVFALKVKENIEKVRDRRGVKGHLASKLVMDSYVTYLRWRKLLPVPKSVAPVGYLAAPALLRESAQNIRLHAAKCNVCGTVQYPAQRVCTRCHSKDQFLPVRLSDKKATIFTFSMDYVDSPIDVPIVITMLDFEGGGRSQFYMTDRVVEQVKIGMPVEMSFRKLEERDGIHNYFWKSVPQRA